MPDEATYCGVCGSRLATQTIEEKTGASALDLKKTYDELGTYVKEYLSQTKTTDMDSQSALEKLSLLCQALSLRGKEENDLESFAAAIKKEEVRMKANLDEGLELVRRGAEMMFLTKMRIDQGQNVDELLARSKADNAILQEKAASTEVARHIAKSFWEAALQVLERSGPVLD